MTVAADQAVVPAYLAYADEKPLDGEALASARSGELLALPEGWDISGGSTRTLVVQFAAADDPAVPPGVILGDSDRPTPTIVASERIPLVWLQLTHGEATCNLEIATIESALARTWADSEIRGGVLTSSPLGKAAAGGATAVIDGGDRLIRGTYSDAWKGTGNRDDDVKHFGEIADGAREFLAGLVAAAQG
jgi:hypothetical protein